MNKSDTKPVITITISGNTGSGKTTLAKHLASSLTILSHADVSLFDDGERVPVPSSHSHLPLHFNAAIDIIVEKN
jgi:type IV secretory pathway VirB4 component